MIKKIAMISSLAASVMLSAPAFAGSYTYDVPTMVDRFSPPMGWKEIKVNVGQDTADGFVTVDFDFEDVRTINVTLVDPNGNLAGRIFDSNIDDGEGSFSKTYDVELFSGVEIYGEWTVRILAYSKGFQDPVTLDSVTLNFAD